MAVRASADAIKNGIPLQWSGISRHLIASLFAVEQDDGTGYQELVAEGRIDAPATDMNFDATMNWQSPFENSGPESKAPALMAMVQSGQLGVVMQALQGLAPEALKGTAIGDSVSGATDSLIKKAQELRGRTGITKLNSRQIFSGMPPIKIAMTLHFRAIKDPLNEVEAPYRRLVSWALPQEVASDSVVIAAAKAAKEGGSFLKALFPSKSPLMVGLEYAAKRYLPMVIEHVSNPMDGPKDEHGNNLYLAVQVQLSTLTALDRADFKQIYRRN